MPSAGAPRSHTAATRALLPALLLACASRSASLPAAMTQTLPMPAPTPPTSPAPTWSAWDGPLKVLTIVGRPGPVVSMAAPPPGPAAFQAHPFLSVASSSPVHENGLHRLLSASRSLDAFLQRLRDAGMVVREEAPTP